MIRKALILIGAALVLGAADDPANYLKDPAQEARARELFQEIRCVVCQNETIAGSNAPIAQDLRMLVRDQIEKGRSDRQIRDHLLARYGDFILLRPRFTLRNALLWLTPFAIVLIGGAAILFRRRPATAAPAENDLSDDELKALQQLQENSRQSPVV